MKNKKKLLRLACETAKHRPYLEKILDSPELGFLHKDGSGKNRSLALVLLFEDVLGKGLQNQTTLTGNKGSVSTKMIRTFVKYHSEIRTEVDRLKRSGCTPENSLVESNAPKLPRYVRINTLKGSLQEVLVELEQSGWEICRLKKTITPKKYRKLVSCLEFPQAYVDAHIDNLLIFPHGIDLHDSPMVKNGVLVLQDKASCLPAYVLRPEPDTHAIDVCAAPGMKTTHLASIMQNKGRIWAFDKSKERAHVLSQILDKNGVRMASVCSRDWLKVDVEDAKFSKVEYAIVDPPCSGSGMVKRGEFLDEFEEMDERRVRALANLQAMLLKHTLKLPTLKRLVYSTCSIHREENESVVLEALEDPQIGARFELVDPMPTWTNRGLADSGIGEKCLRASADHDLTNGFFVALFQKRE